MSLGDETGDGVGESEAHHLPAEADWPQGFGEASWWPFVTAAGVSAVYVGVAVFLFTRDGDGTPVLGPAVLLAGIATFLLGLYGWTYHAFVSHYWQGGHGDDSKLRWGMLLFLGSEIATFGAGFVYYFFVRVGTWPPEGAELPHLLSSLILVNTAILIASSLTLHWAHVRLHRGNRRSFRRWLVVTLLLGVAFLGGQVYEYYEFVVNEGLTLGGGVFSSAFFGLTGLHGFHVTLGVAMLAILLFRTLVGQFSADRDTAVTTVSMYWHFVDAVWIFLVATIYVWASV